MRLEAPTLLTTTPTDRLTEDLLRATRIFVAVAADSQASEEDGLSLQQYRALALLASQEGQRPADLARSLGVTPSTTTALCDRLAQKRLISRRRRGGDRRSVHLVVSPKGRMQLEKIAAAARQAPRADPRSCADGKSGATGRSSTRFCQGG